MPPLTWNPFGVHLFYGGAELITAGNLGRGLIQSKSDFVHKS